MDKQLINDKERKKRNLLKRDLYLDYFNYKIKNNENFSFTKFGDGELKCIFGFHDGEENCDRHPYTKELGELLKVALEKMARRADVFIGDWTGWAEDEFSQLRDDHLNCKGLIPNYLYYELLLTHDSLNHNLRTLLESIKNSKRKKIFIGPNKLNGIKNLLNVDEIIIAPETNSFSKYKEIKENAVKSIQKDAIFLFSFGFSSKILTSDLLSLNKEITILDFGSGFDPILLNKETRVGQVHNEKAKKFFESLLT